MNKDLIKGEDDEIEIQIKGHKRDEENNKKYKFPLSCNFIHPKIDQEDTQIQFKILFPDFAFLIFKIKSEKKIVCSGCLPAKFIRRGYRVLPLYNKKMYHDNYSFLMVKITKKKEQVKYDI